MIGLARRRTDAGVARSGSARRPSGRARAAILGAVAGLVLAGCGGDGGRQETLALQNDIRHQLPEKVRQSSNLRVSVREVQCTSRGGNGYDCIATISRPDTSPGGTLGGIVEDIAIDGTCDDHGCVWRSIQ